MVITTEPFEDLAIDSARSLGVENPRVLVVGHPIGGIADEVIIGRAEAAVDSAIVLLTA